MNAFGIDPSDGAVNPLILFGPGRLQPKCPAYSTACLSCPTQAVMVHRGFSLSSDEAWYDGESFANRSSGKP